MAMTLASIQHGISKSPPVITIYGDGGIGKDTFASNAPSPIFIFTENSVGMLDVARLIATTYEEVMESTAMLLTEKHDYKTVVYSTLDWLEPMVWNYLIRMQPQSEKGQPISNIESYGYGKGYKLALDYWRDFIDLMTRLRTERDMMVIFVAHPTVRKITPPDSDSYDSYMLKLQDSEKTSAKDKIVECCDAVLFANWRVALTGEKLGFGESRNRGVGAGERIVYTEQRPAYEAKNRYSLPAQIHIRDKEWSDLWDILAKSIPWFQQFGGEQQANPAAIAAPAPAPTPAPTVAPVATPAPTQAPQTAKTITSIPFKKKSA